MVPSPSPESVHGECADSAVLFCGAPVAVTKHLSQRPGSAEGVPCATPHRSQSLGDIGMLQRLHRHILQMTSVSVAFNGLTRTDLPQIEQGDIRRLDRVGTSCVAIILKPPCFW